MGVQDSIKEDKLGVTTGWRQLVSLLLLSSHHREVKMYSFSQKTISVWNKLSTDCVHASSVKAKIKPTYSDTYQLHVCYTNGPLYNIIIIFDTVVRQKQNFKHEK